MQLVKFWVRGIVGLKGLMKMAKVLHKKRENMIMNYKRYLMIKKIQKKLLKF